MMTSLLNLKKSWENPFAEPTLPASHYHPTLQKPLTSSEKHIKIQPNIPGHRPTVALTEPVSISPGERIFLDQGHSYITKELPTHDTPSPGNASSKFDESWPSSERPSTIESPRDRSANADVHPVQSNCKLLQSNLELGCSSSSSITAFRQPSIISSLLTDFSQTAGMESHPLTSDHLSATENRRPTGSTIHKYIQRFRYAEPRSREEREREKAGSKKHDFWWLHNITSSSPIQTSTPSASTPTALSSFATPNLSDNQTSEIQQKADALIERSESSLTTDDSFFSSEANKLFPSKPEGTTSMLRTAVPTLSSKRTNLSIHEVFQAPARPPAPEDDILYQWRLNRKLEQARDNPRKWTPATHTAGRSSSNDPRSHSTINSHKIDSKLSEFRERLKREESSALKLPQALQIMTDVRNAGSDPIPQSIATQTNDILKEKPVLDSSTFHKGVGFESTLPAIELGEKKSPRQSTNWQVASPRHCNANSQKNQDLVPHLHMSCDIIPCNEDLHHGKQRDSKTLPQDAQSTAWPPKQKLNFVDEECSSDEVKERSEDGVKHLLKSDGNKREIRNEILHNVESTRGKPESQESKFDEIQKNHLPANNNYAKTVENVARQPPTKRLTSSPISMTIGKVISDHLFTQCSTSPCSSVQSVPSSPSPAHHSTPSDSSGDEFIDDELLQVLRQKRTKFEEKLRKIDQRLMDVNDA